MMDIKMLATQTGIAEKDLLEIMQQLASIIKERFETGGIPMTIENVERAIPLGLKMMIEMGDRYFNDPEFRKDMQEKIWDALQETLNNG